MLNNFDSGEVMSWPAKSPLMKKSLEQIKYERGHYQSQFGSANVRARYVLRFQSKKLDKLIKAFEPQNKSVACQSLRS